MKVIKPLKGLEPTNLDIQMHLCDRRLHPLNFASKNPTEAWRNTQCSPAFQKRGSKFGIFHEDPNKLNRLQTDQCATNMDIQYMLLLPRIGI